MLSALSSGLRERQAADLMTQLAWDRGGEKEKPVQEEKHLGPDEGVGGRKRGGEEAVEEDKLEKPGKSFGLCSASWWRHTHLYPCRKSGLPTLRMEGGPPAWAHSHSASRLDMSPPASHS